MAISGVGRGDSARTGAAGKSGLLAGQPLSSTADLEDAAAMREDSPLVTFIDESSPAPSHHPSYSWRHASMIIVGEVLGTGIMGLPSAVRPSHAFAYSSDVASTHSDETGGLLSGLRWYRLDGCLGCSPLRFSR